MKLWRKYPEIEGRQVTVETLDEVAAWCGGHVKGIKLDPKDRVIEFWHNEYENEAAVGQFIIKDGKNKFTCSKKYLADNFFFIDAGDFLEQM